MAPLPKPSDQRVRRNTPTIPTKALPLAGRVGRPPSCPYPLGKSGKAWWSWAWATPQACAWHKGYLFTIARRAQLEDEVDALRVVEGTLNLDEFVDRAELDGLDDAVKDVKHLIGVLKGLATGELTLMKEMREIEDRIGLTPKGMAALHWEIARDEVGAKRDEKNEGAPGRRLKAVDPALVGQA